MKNILLLLVVAAATATADVVAWVPDLSATREHRDSGFMRFWKRVDVKSYEKHADGSIRIVTTEGKIIETSTYVLEDDSAIKRSPNVVPEEDVVDMTPEEAEEVWKLRNHA